MFRANQTAYLSDVIAGVLGRWGVAREQNNPPVKAERPSVSQEDDKGEARRRWRRRRWRNRRYTGLGVAGSGQIKTGWT